MILAARSVVPVEYLCLPHGPLPALPPRNARVAGHCRVSARLVPDRPQLRSGRCARMSSQPDQFHSGRVVGDDVRTAGSRVAVAARSGPGSRPDGRRAGCRVPVAQLVELRSLKSDVARSIRAGGTRWSVAQLAERRIVTPVSSRFDPWQASHALSSRQLGPGGSGERVGRVVGVVR